MFGTSAGSFAADQRRRQEATKTTGSHSRLIDDSFLRLFPKLSLYFDNSAICRILEEIPSRHSSVGSICKQFEFSATEHVRLLRSHCVFETLS